MADVPGRNPPRAASRSFAVIAAAYLVQGCVYGFGGFVLLPRLAAEGVSLTAQAAILALGSVPWLLKLAWAPWVDRRRSPASVAAVAMIVVGLGLGGLALAWARGPDAMALASIWLGIHFALALQDVAIDAWTLDRITPAQRGAANAWMLAGHHLGFEAVGGLWLGRVAASEGIGTALVGAMIGVLLLAALPWTLAGAPRGASGGAVRAPWRSVVPGLGVALWAGTAVVADVATSTVSAALLVSELRWPPEVLAVRLPWVSLGSTLLGMLSAAWLVDRVGHRGAAGRSSVALGVVWVAFAALRSHWAHTTVVLVGVALQGWVTAIFYVGMHAWLMDRVRTRRRATGFAVLMAIFNLPRVLVPLGAAWVQEHTGWVVFFLGCGLVQIAYGVGFAAGADEHGRDADEPRAPAQPSQVAL